MSVRRRRQKAAQREIEYRKRNVAKGPGLCMRCGEPGPHFVPPSLGDIGFFMCDPPADIVNHSRQQ